MKVKAINLITGSEYIFCELTDVGLFYLVSTAIAYPQKWLVDKSNVKIL